MLGNPFHVDFGYGTATLTDNMSQVDLERWFRLHDFCKFTMRSSDGNEMDDEELNDAMERMPAQETSMAKASAKVSIGLEL